MQAGAFAGSSRRPMRAGHSKLSPLSSSPSGGRCVVGDPEASGEARGEQLILSRGESIALVRRSGEEYVRDRTHLALVLAGSGSPLPGHIRGTFSVDRCKRAQQSANCSGGFVAGRNRMQPGAKTRG